MRCWTYRRKSSIRPARRNGRARHGAGHVEFQNVTFQYPGAEEPALTGRVVHGRIPAR